MEKFTVIIPTRDRGETLGPTLQTCLRQTYSNYEIIVSDNCSSDNTREVVKCCNDSRIRYINPGRRLSMSGNFEFALSHVADGFAMFIGSDDGLMPDALQYVDAIIKKYKVDAVSCRQASYVWPEFPDNEIAGRLSFGGWREDVELRNSSEWIRKTLNFRVHYCFDLPNLYCGFVHKRIIDKAYKNGKYFQSITPDAYSALATAIFIDRYAFSHRPFAIAGASAKSNGASAMHPSGDNVEASQFYSENDIAFCEGFVNCPSYEVILGEAFGKLSQTFPELCSPFDINYAAMLRGALSSSNARTEGEIHEAVRKMAINFGVTADIEMERPHRLRGRGISDLFRALIGLFAASRIVAVPHSADIGVRDVDDAALAAHVLLSMRKARREFMTNKTLINQLLKKIIKN